MDLSSKKEKVKGHKNMSLKRQINSAKNALAGLVYAYGNEQSLWLHGLGTILAIILGIIFKISFIKWAILIISLMIVLSVELLNTAIEAAVDLVTKEFHPLAKIAKDCGGAATFVATIVLLVIAGFIFIPELVALF